MTFNIRLRKPTPTDGRFVHELISQCSPLDTNSMYCNLLQCTHFNHTSVAAENNGRLIGFISGYLIPDKPDTLFIWQVAVSSEARGMKLATRMLQHLLHREACHSVNYLETTITQSNRASWALFESFSRQCDARLERSLLFDHQRHFGGTHDSESLVRIGPIKPQATTTNAQPQEMARSNSKGQA